MGIFREIFRDLFEVEKTPDKFLGVIKGENFKKAEKSIPFKQGDSLGKGKRKRPYIAFREENGFLRVFFLTTKFTASVCINIRERCFLNEKSSELCKQLQDVCFTYRYAYLVREETLITLSEICGRCFDLEELNDILVVGGET